MSSVCNRVREPEPLWCYQVVTWEISPIANMYLTRPSPDGAQDYSHLWPEITKQVPMLESIGFFEMRSLNTMEYSSRITELFFQSCYEQRFCPEFTLVTWMQSSVSGKPDMLYFGQEWTMTSKKALPIVRPVQISKLAIPDSQISDCAWSRVAADLFSLHDRSYNVLVYYYSNFL